MGDALSIEDASRACARAEFGTWLAILTERDRQVAEIEATDSAMYKRMAVNAVALDIAQRLHVSEQSVWRIVEQGRRLRSSVPTAWSAFADGRIGAQKASVIAVAVERLKHDESVLSLDEVVVDYATTHTPSELRRWLDQLIDRLEPVDIDDADKVRAERCVTVDHGHDGMSWINGHIPSVVAVAAMKRLRKAARALPDDGRTLDQKVADLYAAWLTNATGTECDIAAEIAVVVEAEALAGVTDTPARVDDEAIAPVPWVLELAESDSTLWTRLLCDPAGRVLDTTHIGYQPPPALRSAIHWRDMRCRINGCSQMAESTDLDHDIPFDAGGTTSGHNLRCLCRRHHGMKGHGLLPATAYAPPAVHLVRLPSPSITFEYVAA